MSLSRRKWEIRHLNIKKYTCLCSTSFFRTSPFDKFTNRFDPLVKSILDFIIQFCNLSDEKPQCSHSPYIDKSGDSSVQETRSDGILYFGFETLKSVNECRMYICYSLESTALILAFLANKIDALIDESFFQRGTFLVDIVLK